MMSTARSDDWREIAEAARKEYDPEKLIALVTELNRVLEHEVSLSVPQTENSFTKD